MNYASNERQQDKQAVQRGAMAKYQLDQLEKHH
jgi:hypothetical protein